MICLRRVLPVSVIFSLCEAYKIIIILAFIDKNPF
jgi:hypothetical protein